MTRAEVAGLPEAKKPNLDRPVPEDRAPLRNERTPGNGETKGPVGPPIFRRLWSTGLLEQQDLDALQSQSWARSIFNAKSRLDVGHGLCILASGLAVRYRASSTGDRQSTALILPGDICDYSVITGTESRAGPVALTKSSYVQISSEQVITLSEQAPGVLAAILTQLAIDQAMSEELLFSIARRTALERTAHLLCELEFRLRRIGLSNEGRFLLPMTQAEIGHHLGLTPVHVNRTMQELRRRQLVRTKGPSIELSDLPKLQRVAEFSPHYLNAAANEAGQPFDA